jgi:small subunit ribosomal protein S6
MGSFCLLRDYELTVILSPDIAEEDVQAAIDRVHNGITSRGGEVVSVDAWGRRRLAYPIKRKLEGSYFISQIRLEPDREREFEQALNISEEVLRHLVVIAGS